MSEWDRISAEIEALARVAAEACGVEVVEIRFHGQGRHSMLRVDIDRPGKAGVGLADCEAVSRALDRSIEEAGLLEDRSYDLQVSSPGLDRPIRTDDDYRRNAGRRIVIECAAPDRRVEIVRGVLLALLGDVVLVECADGASMRLPRSSVISAVQDADPEPGRPGGTPGRKPPRRRGIV